MQRVICVLCKDVGYTASPECSLCRCGGKLKITEEGGSKSMHVLLILKEGDKVGNKVMVKVDKKLLKEKVINLLEENREKEVFDLVYSQADVHSYIPPHQKPVVKPDLILIEDML